MVHLRGLPTKATKEDVVEFLKEWQPAAVYLVFTTRRSSGEVNLGFLVHQKSQGTQRGCPAAQRKAHQARGCCPSCAFWPARVLASRKTLGASCTHTKSNAPRRWAPRCRRRGR